jgi:DNA-binding XRE family transcriptional regulator
VFTETGVVIDHEYPFHEPQALELLGICERHVVVVLPADSTSNRRVRTPLPLSPKTLGDHVLGRRKDLGLRQGQLARLLGVWRATLGSWEGNHYEPTGSVRARVIAWLGFDPCE